MADRGVLYIAFGEDYVVEAERSAESLRAESDVSVTVLTDCASYESTHFDRVERVNRGDSVFLQTIDCMSRSPYERTIYLDTDVHVVDNITDLFNLLDEFDIAAKRKSGYYPTGPRGGQYPEIPNSFPEYNRGVLVYRSGPDIQEFFDNWYYEYTTYITKGGNDQPAFRKALYHSDLRLAGLSERYHCRFVYPGYLSFKAKTLHGRPEQVGAERYEEVENIINKTDLPRVFFPHNDGLELLYRVTDFNLQHLKQFQLPLYEHLVTVFKETCKRPFRRPYHRLRDAIDDTI